MTISRGQVPSPVLPEEVVPVAALGGDVLVRGLLMSERMALEVAVVRASRQPAAGETEDEAAVRARSVKVSQTLARCVLLDDGKPLYTAAQWDVFGNLHADDTLNLYRIAKRLNGEDAEDTEKN